LKTGAKPQLFWDPFEKQVNPQNVIGRRFNNALAGVSKINPVNLL
jgi:hypothetical protein